MDLDIGNGRITLAQGYYSIKERDEAPADKASDMNSAIAWLLSGDIVETDPENFWVYNNGITILTLGIDDAKNGNKKSKEYLLSMEHKLLDRSVWLMKIRKKI